jgi:hypothetical protein
MLYLGIRNNLLRWTFHLIEPFKSKVMMYNTYLLSGSVDVSGVYQGSTLGPLLFIFFTVDIAIFY